MLIEFLLFKTRLLMCYMGSIADTFIEKSLKTSVNPCAFFHFSDCSVTM